MKAKSLILSIGVFSCVVMVIVVVMKAPGNRDGMGENDKGVIRRKSNDVETIKAEVPATENALDNMLHPLEELVLEKFPQANSEERAFVRQCIVDALNKAVHDHPVIDIEQARSKFGLLFAVWQQHDRGVSFIEYTATVQLMLYYYLTPPSLDTHSEQRLKDQHCHLLSITDLSGKLNISFVPEEIAGDVDMLLKKGHSDFARFLSCSWLRLNQLPMSDSTYEKVVEKIETHIEQTKTELESELETELENWRRNFIARGQHLPNTLDKEIINTLYVTCLQRITFIYGNAMRTYFLFHMNELYNQNRYALFPFYRMDIYGCTYNIRSGLRIRFSPKNVKF